MDSFLVPIRDDQNKRLRLRLADNIVLQKVLRVRDQDIHVVQCCVQDPEMIETLATYDRDVLEHMLEHGNTWFHTELSEEKIRQMFLPSLGNYQEIRAMVSSVLEPKVILNHQILTGFCELLPLLESRADLSHLQIFMEIEPQGIYIRSKRFGIRWIVKHIRIIEEEFQKSDNAFDQGTRLDVHEGLREDLNEMEGQIHAEIGDLQKKIRNLEEYLQKARKVISDVECLAETDMSGQEWAAKAETLSKMIWEYQRTRWNEN